MSPVIKNFLKLLTETFFKVTFNSFFVNNDRNIDTIDLKIKILSSYFKVI